MKAHTKAIQLWTRRVLLARKLPKRDCLLRVFCDLAMKSRTTHLKKMRHLPLSILVVVFELLMHPLAVIPVSLLLLIRFISLQFRFQLSGVILDVQLLNQMRVFFSA